MDNGENTEEVVAAMLAHIDVLRQIIQLQADSIKRNVPIDDAVIDAFRETEKEIECRYYYPTYDIQEIRQAQHK